MIEHTMVVYAATVGGTPPTVAYDVIQWGAIVFAGFILYGMALFVGEASRTVRQVREIRAQAREGDEGDESELPIPPPESLPDYRATDSSRYDSLMPVIESIESTPEIVARGHDLIHRVRPIASTLAFVVPGESRDYAVTLDPLNCECAFWEHRGLADYACKHIVAVAGHVLVTRE